MSLEKKFFTLPSGVPYVEIKKGGDVIRRTLNDEELAAYNASVKSVSTPIPDPEVPVKTKGKDKITIDKPF